MCCVCQEHRSPYVPLLLHHTHVISTSSFTDVVHVDEIRRRMLANARVRAPWIAKCVHASPYVAHANVSSAVFAFLHAGCQSTPPA